MARADLKYIIGFETNDAPLQQSIRLVRELEAQERTLKKARADGLISARALDRGLKDINKSMAELRVASGKGAMALNKFEARLAKSGKASRQFQLAMQQGGYQVQDFIVQVQSGTNPLVAFSQQASQLAGFFAGPWGAMIGLGIAALSGLAMAFQGAGRAAKEAKKEFDAAIASFDQQNMMALTGLDEKQLEYGEKVGKAVTKSLKALKDLQDFDKNPTSGVLDRVYLAQAYQEALEDERKIKEEAQAYTDARNESLKITQQANDAAKRAADIESGRLSEADAMVDAFNKRKEYEEDLYKNLTERAKVAVAMYGKEGEAALVQKQKLEYQKLENDLKENGLNLEGKQAQKALQSLKVAQNMELQEYKRVQAIKEREKAEREAAQYAKKSLQERKQELAELYRESQRLARLQTPFQKLTSTLESGFEDMFNSMIDGTMSFKDAFRSMAAEVIKELYRIFVAKQAAGFISNAITNAVIGPVQGPMLPSGNFDGGGFTGYGPRSGGMDGKGGFLAMLHPNETVIDHTKGQSAGGVTVVQNINVSTGVQQTVRTEIRQLMPQIAESAKAAVVDGKRRGGNYGRALA